jgi:N-dimethylarginine dimethylaminohydrolase
MAYRVIGDEELKGQESLKVQTQDAYLKLLLCPPEYLRADIANNVFMKKLPEKERKINVDKAMAQFFEMAGLFAQDAFVYLLPPKRGLQDQMYISNAGVCLPHLDKTFVLAKFKAEGRPGEEKELSKFLDIAGYKQFTPPYFFEGKAEFLWLRDNIYFGGYGQRSVPEALDWIAQKFDARVIKIEERDQKRYHLDCSIFPLSKDKVMFATDGQDRATVKEIEKVAEIIPVSKEAAQMSVTNNQRIGSIVYTMTDISELKRSDEDYEKEKRKNEEFEKIVMDAGLTPIFIDLSEIGASGAALSCCCLPLNGVPYPS